MTLTPFSSHKYKRPGARRGESRRRCAVKGGKDEPLDSCRRGYYFHRDEALDARNAFATTKASFEQKQGGGWLGGPVRENQTKDKIAVIVFVNAQGLSPNTYSQTLYDIVAPAIAKAKDAAGKAKPADPAFEKYVGMYTQPLAGERHVLIFDGELVVNVAAVAESGARLDEAEARIRERLPQGAG
jgi:hypothetical protein